MRKTVTHIDCPDEWKSTNDWDSHKPMLWVGLSKERYKAFVEFGMGYGSTPLLKEWFKGKSFDSVETNKEWCEKFTNGYDLDVELIKLGIRRYTNNGHSILHLDNYADFKMNSSAGELYFIDCAPASERIKLIQSLNKNNSIFIIHDTEPGAEYVYGLDDILSTFKYRLDYQPEGMPHTTAVSNFIDVTKWI